MLRWSRWFIRTLLGLSVTIVVLAVALVWRVSREPVSLEFLIPYIQESLSLTNVGVRVGLEDAVLAWNEDEQALRLRLRNATFSGDRNLSLKVPEVDLALSGASLLRGVIAPTYLRLGGVEALVLRDADGRFRLGLPGMDDAPNPAATTEGEDFAAVMFGAMFDRLSKPVDLRDPLGQVNSVSVQIARLVILDRKLGHRWEAPGAVFQAARGDNAVRALLMGNLDWRGKRVNLSLNAEYSATERAANTSIRFEGVALADFADLAPDLKPLAGVHMPLSGNVSFRIAETGDIANLRYNLEAGAGYVAMPELWTEPLSLRDAKAEGRLETSNTPGVGDRLTIESAVINFNDGVQLGLSGDLHRPSPDDLGLEVKGRFTELPVDALNRYWPKDMAKNARDWVTARIKGGKVRQADFNARLTPPMMAGKQKLPRDAVRLAFNFEGLSVDYFPPLTRMTEAKGEAVLDADEFNLTVSTGRVGPMQASSGKLRVDGLQARDQHADIAISVAGNNRDLLTLIDQKPLGYPTQLGIKPATVEGTGKVDTTFYLPLDHKVKLDDVKFTAKASLLNLAIPQIYERFALTDGIMQLSVDPKGLDAEGTAALNGVPARINWRQEFDSKLPVEARYRIAGRADNAGRKALGFDLDPFVDGPVDALAEIESRRAGRETVIRTQLDLTPAKVAIADIYWAKPADQPGRANFVARLKPGQPVLFEDLRVTADRFTADGSASLANDNSWSLRLGMLKIGENEANVDFRRAANGDMVIRAEGKRYDLSEFVKASDAEVEEKPQPKLDLRLRFDEARLDEYTLLRNFALDMKRGTLFTEQMDLAGAFNGGGTLAMQVSPDPDPAKKQRVMTVRSDNAGAVFGYLGVEKLQGGSLSVDARYDDTKPGRPLEGTLTARQFRAVQAPFLARLLGIGSFTGLAALLSGEGINFETAVVPFTQKDGVLTLHPSRIRGPQLGITFEGSVNRKTNNVNITGTAVPAFVLNTILGRIPVLGDLFIGDGIVGVNFAVSGPRENTDMSVNPLSAIAPGFLRRIFQAGGGSGEPAPDGTPPNPSIGAPGQQ